MSTGVQAGARAPVVTLLDTEGAELSLPDLTAGKPTVLFFLRHYG
jgi:peroxiredoxin